MCNIIYVDDNEFETVGDLKLLFPRSDVNLFKSYGYNTLDDNQCLCCINLADFLKHTTAKYTTKNNYDFTILEF